MINLYSAAWNLEVVLNDYIAGLPLSINSKVFAGNIIRMSREAGNYAGMIEEALRAIEKAKWNKRPIYFYHKLRGIK